ncbi:hypothetical protein KC337_g49 [Hortaea werneckii]|nr:hypothetical protein KC337_g49 [Hortaea werneckii]
MGRKSNRKAREEPNPRARQWVDLFRGPLFRASHAKSCEADSGAIKEPFSTWHWILASLGTSTHTKPYLALVVHARCLLQQVKHRLRFGDILHHLSVRTLELHHRPVHKCQLSQIVACQVASCQLCSNERGNCAWK